VRIVEKIHPQYYMNVWIALTNYVMSVLIFVRIAENIYVMAVIMIIKRNADK